MAIQKLELGGLSLKEDTGFLEYMINRLEKKTKKLSQTVSGIWEGGGTALKNLAAQLEAAARKASSTSSKLRRSLAGFDQLERLAEPAGSTTTTQAQKALALLQQLKDTSDGLRERLLEPITDWFGSSLPQTLGTAGSSLWSFLGLTQRGSETTAQYATAWGNVSGYLTKWTTLAPVGTQVTGVLSQVLEKAGISAKTAGGDLADMTDKGKWLTQAMGKVAAAAGLSSQGVRNAWAGSGSWFAEYVSDPVTGALSGLWAGVQSQAEESWKGVKEIFGSAGSAVFSSLSQAWEGVKSTFSSNGVLPEVESGVLSGFREAANQIIDGINGMVSTPFSGLSGILGKLKEFKIGTFQPFKGLDFSIQVPKIPRLAQGAVIPPNREFLAVLGDQSHGTNIEAPLSTIQEAVAITMEDMIASNMAGHQATVELLREILQAVLGISIGDDLLAGAVRRYNAKLSVITGGTI